MHRLHTLDAAWLELEQAGPPIATGVVAVLDGPCPSVADVRRLVADRRGDLPSLGWVVQAGAGLRRPRWQDAGPPDLRVHVRARRVGRGAAALESFVSDVIARPLPRSRPLWEIAVVRGLVEERWAFVWRLHHAVADGQGSQSMLGHLFDTAVDGSRRMADDLVAFRPNTRTGPAPDEVGAVGRVVSALRHVPKAAHLVRDLTPRPPGSVTGPLSSRRRWVRGTVPLAGARALARQYDVTVNDVVLASVAHGFRRLLLARGERTEHRTLRSMVPVSLRPPGDDEPHNKVGAAWVDLPVGAMPLQERARSIARATSWQKQVGTPVLGGLLLSVSDHLVPGPVLDAVVSHADRVPAWMTDTLVTNVPGAPFPMYVLGRRMRFTYPVIPIGGHVRITVGVVSHDGWLCIGVTGDGRHAADVDVLRDGTVEALDAQPPQGAL